MTREPTSDLEAREWIRHHLGDADLFREIAWETERHRASHGCDAYTSDDGPLLGVLARAVQATRVLEVGTALGYTAAWLAYGAQAAQVDTIESDPSHAEQAKAQLLRAGVADRVRVHVGRSPRVLADFDPPYDLVFYDASVPTPGELDVFHRLLRPAGLLVTSNLFLGRHVPDLPGLEEGAAYRRRLLNPEHWLTAFADLKGVSVRL